MSGRYRVTLSGRTRGAQGIASRTVIVEVPGPPGIPYRRALDQASGAINFAERCAISHAAIDGAPADFEPLRVIDWTEV